MARNITVGIVMLFLIVSTGPATADLSLVWSDEFEGSSLNTSDWNYSIGDGCPDLCGWGNNELEYYRSQNVDVADGHLVITARQEYYGGRSFTSGKIHTRNKRSFLYGRMEMRAKIPTGGGMWPAFWMMPQDDVYGGWAASGEIDIMESANSTDWINGTIHYGGSWPENTYSHGTYNPGGINFADDFHLYAVEWEPEQIRWYVDGVLYSTRTSSQWYSAGAPGNPLAPFDQEFYIILNAAVGGHYTNCTEPGCITADLPQEFVVDYVRVYQETGNQAPSVILTGPTSGDNPPAGDIVMTADASDADGSVAAVEFYDGSTFLGADTTAPYAFTWTDVADGCYAVTVRAVDDQGAFGTDTGDLTVGAGCGQASFLGAPIAVPAVIEAEDFDLGGESVAYHDTDAGNAGAGYRTDESVDIETCTDVGGGYNVGWLRETEWLEYTIDVPAAGEYPIDVRVASLAAGGSFRIEFNGFDRTGEVIVPVTGGWQNWTTVSITANLPAGQQVMRFVPVIEGYNLNHIEIQESTAVGVNDPLPAGHVLYPCYPNPFNPSTTISYSLTRSERVRLEIFDVSGRLVRELVGGVPRPAGRQEVVWRGVDDGGRAVASGTYFYRLDAGGQVEMRAMTLVK